MARMLIILTGRFARIPLPADFSVTIPKTKSAHWDCEKAGLAVESKDKVRVIIDGSKY